MGKKDKKEKKPKTKSVSFTSQVFSKQFESLYNNKKFSDVTIVLNNEEIPAHLIVLQSLSDYFNDNKQNDKITISEGSSFKSLLEYFYKGAVDVKDDKVTFEFIQLALKYKAKYLSDLKLAASKGLLNLVLEVGDKDQTQCEKYLELLSFKKLDEDDLKKIQKKKEWLKKNSVWKKKLKTAGGEGSGSDDDSDKSGSDSDSDKSGSDSDDSDKSSESESESSEEEEDKVAEFDTKNSHSYYTYDKKSKEITKPNNSGWNASVISKKPTDKFAVLFVKGGINTVIGFIDISKYNKNAGNYNSGHTWWIDTSSGLRGDKATSDSAFNSGQTISTNSVFGAKFNRKKGEISFYKEKQLIGISHKLDKNLKTKFHALIDTYSTNDVVFKFTKPKFK